VIFCLLLLLGEVAMIFYGGSSSSDWWTIFTVVSSAFFLSNQSPIVSIKQLYHASQRDFLQYTSDIFEFNLSFFLMVFLVLALIIELETMFVSFPDMEAYMAFTFSPWFLSNPLQAAAEGVIHTIFMSTILMIVAELMFDRWGHFFDVFKNSALMPCVGTGRFLLFFPIALYALVAIKARILGDRYNLVVQMKYCLLGGHIVVWPLVRCLVKVAGCDRDNPHNKKRFNFHDLPPSLTSRLSPMLVSSPDQNRFRDDGSIGLEMIYFFSLFMWIAFCASLGSRVSVSNLVTSVLYQQMFSWALADFCFSCAQRDPHSIDEIGAIDFFCTPALLKEAIVIMKLRCHLPLNDRNRVTILQSPYWYYLFFSIPERIFDTEKVKKTTAISLSYEGMQQVVRLGPAFMKFLREAFISDARQAVYGFDPSAYQKKQKHNELVKYLLNAPKRLFRRAVVMNEAPRAFHKKYPSLSRGRAPSCFKDADSGWVFSEMKVQNVNEKSSLDAPKVRVVNSRWFDAKSGTFFSKKRCLSEPPKALSSVIGILPKELLETICDFADAFESEGVVASPGN
jgi:hypothetical protein